MLQHRRWLRAVGLAYRLVGGHLFGQLRDDCRLLGRQIHALPLVRKNILRQAHQSQLGTNKCSMWMRRLTKRHGWASEHTAQAPCGKMKGVLGPTHGHSFGSTF